MLMRVSCFKELQPRVYRVYRSPLSHRAPNKRSADGLRAYAYALACKDESDIHKIAKFMRAVYVMNK